MQMSIHDVEKALPAMRGSQGNNADDDDDDDDDYYLQLVHGLTWSIMNGYMVDG